MLLLNKTFIDISVWKLHCCR